MNPRFTMHEGCSIASVRIHVKQICKALDYISIKLLPDIDKIMYVTCVLVCFTICNASILEKKLLYCTFIIKYFANQSKPILSDF